MKPLVTIITVCFNSEKTIEKTIQQVLNQTYQNYEYLIIDGNSKDHTLEIVKSYETLFNGKMRILSEPDDGVYFAMNKGIKMAKGQLIGIINSDDFYENDAIENIVRNMTKDKYQVLYGFLKILRGNVEISTILNRHENLEEIMIAHPACFVTRDVYDSFGMFNTEYNSCADYEMMLRFYYSGKIKFIPVYHLIATFLSGIGISS